MICMIPYYGETCVKASEKGPIDLCENGFANVLVPHAWRQRIASIVTRTNAGSSSPRERHGCSNDDHIEPMDKSFDRCGCDPSIMQRNPKSSWTEAELVRMNCS